MIKKPKPNLKLLAEKVKERILQVPPLNSSPIEKEMWEQLKEAFPASVYGVLIQTGDGVGLIFSPKDGKMKMQTLTEIYMGHLPELNELEEREAYEKAIDEFLNEG